MSGHSKWSTIKRKKQATDAKKGQIFTKLARELTAAARAGGGDPEANFTLRLAIDKAKAANMPKENIERAIQRGLGELKGEELVEVTYEAYAPHGVALILQVLTDNRNRAVADIRRIFNRQGGSLGETGCVAWQFEPKGYITIERDEQDVETIFEAAIDLGADDVDIGDDLIEIYTKPEDLQWVQEGLQRRHISVASAELSMIPKTLVQLGQHEAFQVMRLIDALEELDDVQKVYSNLDISDELMAEYEKAA